jgi:hypothetical protein
VTLENEFSGLTDEQLLESLKEARDYYRQLEYEMSERERSPADDYFGGDLLERIDLLERECQQRGLASSSDND